MRLIWAAIRAVTVEMIGVIVVVWFLFGAAGWTLESAGARPTDEAKQLWDSFADTTVQAVQVPEDEQQRAIYVEGRLEHYSQLYRDAAQRHLRRVGEDFDIELPKTQRPLRFGIWDLGSKIGGGSRS